MTEQKKGTGAIFKNTGSILGTIYKSSENATAGKDINKKIQPLLIVNKINNTIGGNFDLEEVSSTNNN